jgi:hypothetical protein
MTTYTPACPKCHGPGARLDPLHGVEWFRCSDCGWDFPDEYSVLEVAED